MARASIWNGYDIDYSGAQLFAIGLLASLSLLGVARPLNALEDWLRNGSVGAQGFIQRWPRRLLYYDVRAWMLTLSYVMFAPGGAAADPA